MPQKPELIVDYLQESEDARISTTNVTQGDLWWPRVISVCSNNSTEFKRLSSSSFMIPWWSFLSIRAEIREIISSGPAVFKPANDTVRKLLVEANKQNNSFLSPNFPNPLPPEEVQSALNKLGFSRCLTDEQKRNVGKLTQRSTGATFSVPGAGKTTEAIAYFALSSGLEGHLLIIAPKNAFAAWEEQWQNCFNESTYRFVRLTGGAESITSILEDKPKLMLITYQQFVRVTGLIAKFIHSNETRLFLDESHRAKAGEKGSIGSSILSIAHLPVGKLVMSGTPMPNSTSDLVAQFNFLFPEQKANADNVCNLIQGVYVRTTKNELKIPPVTRFVTKVDMLPGQRRLYDLLKKEVARQSEGLLTSRDKTRLRSMGKSVMRLLQITSNPMLLNKCSDELDTDLISDILLNEESPKLTYVLKRARDITRTGNKVIIWSNFVENVELLSSRLADMGADYIHGGVEAGSELEEDTREAKIKRFHDDDSARVLVANPAAASEGISLHTVCHHAIYLDRNYNAAQYLQSEDRIHRLGLAEGQKTYIEIVECRDSIDESVNRRLEAKVNNMADILNDDSLSIASIVDFDLENDALDFSDLSDLLDIK